MARGPEMAWQRLQSAAADTDLPAAIHTKQKYLSNKPFNDRTVPIFHSTIEM